MNPVIADFFARHGAVRANKVGKPDWTKAPEPILLAWFGSYAALVRCRFHREEGRPATVEEQRAASPIYHAIVTEVNRRAAMPNASVDVIAASWRASLPAVFDILAEYESERPA